MKLSSIVTALTLAACGTSAVWAQDWDMVQPDRVVAIESNTAPLVMPPAEIIPIQQNSNLQWDLGALRADRAESAAQVAAWRAEHRDNAPCFDGEAGSLGNTTRLTGQGYTPPFSSRTGTQSLSTLPPCTTAQYGYVAGGKGGLPTTSMDSFVHDAGGQAELIYGDEGTDDIPPLFSFDTINSGITGQTAAGLTTGHHSNLPSSWY